MMRVWLYLYSLIIQKRTHFLSFHGQPEGLGGPHNGNYRHWRSLYLHFGASVRAESLHVPAGSRPDERCNEREVLLPHCR